VEKKYKKWIMFVGVVGVSFLLFRYFGLDRYFSFFYLKTHANNLKQIVEKNYFRAVLMYIAVYSGSIVATIPAVAPLTLIGGFLFCVLPGMIYSLIGAVLGATISFLMIRYMLGFFLRGRYAQRIENFNDKIKRYGYSYLIILHFLTVIPFLVINTLAALTDVPLITFMLTTLVGCIPLLFVYSLAGEQLASIQSVGDIFSPPLIMSFLLLILLAIIPIVVKRIKETMNR